MDITGDERIERPVAMLRPRLAQGRLSTIARASLGVGVLAGFGLAASLPAGSVAEADPDLVRLIRFMAALKGGLLVAALWAGAWRLARPASMWRMAVYVGAPALMAFGTLALWRLQAAGPAAAALHLGLFGFLAASLTDRDFIPSRRAA